MMESGAVPGFLPSTAGLKFSNHFPPGIAVRTISLPVVGIDIPIGDASNGVCGGMVYAALDLFSARPRLSVPTDRVTPAAGSVLTTFILKRLVDSFALDHGTSSNVARYLFLMSTPDEDSWFVRGVPSIIAQQEWPRIKQDIDSGRPSPLGLVGGERKRITDVRGKVSALGHCHQVLAYAYELDDEKLLTLRVYDSNDPGADDSTIEMSLANLDEATQITTPRITARILGHGTFRAFFRHGYYAAATPPAGISPGPWRP
jgi:hypothetical protein